MTSNRTIVTIAGCAIIGTVLGMLLPGIEAGSGAGIGGAMGIAVSLGGESACRLRRRGNGRTKVDRDG